MSKSKKDTLKSEVMSNIKIALDIIEGRYSNIPDCCIEGFLDGRTYMNVRNSLSEKDQKKLERWQYVPCEKCFKKNKHNELKQNGTSIYGKILMAIIDSLREDK